MQSSELANKVGSTGARRVLSTLRGLHCTFTSRSQGPSGRLSSLTDGETEAGAVAAHSHPAGWRAQGRGAVGCHTQAFY